MSSEKDGSVENMSIVSTTTRRDSVIEARDSALAMSRKALDESRQLIVQASSGFSKLKDRVLENPGMRETEERLTAAVGKLADAVDTVLDNASGKAMLDEIQTLVERQGAYNDILATKLSEALERLDHAETRAASLEARLFALEQRK